MTDQLQLWATPGQRVGRTEQALVEQLQAWGLEGHTLPGAVVAALREMAYNCDATRPGQGKAHATDRYLTQLREWMPKGLVTDEAWASFLDDHASQPTIRHSA